jgi:NAD+ synthase/NAD+ synthase (glutamine-hydrolysing)
MPKSLSVGITQINPTVGDIEGNLSEVLSHLDKDDDIVVFPELSLTGYPPMDLLRHDEIINRQSQAVEKVVSKTEKRDDSPAVVIGATVEEENVLYNTAIVVNDGEILCKYAKRLLPTYDIFDEHRYFQPGGSECVAEIDGHTVGLSVCEDAWWDVKDEGRRQHHSNPIEDYRGYDLDVLLNLSASPYRLGKTEERINRFSRHSKMVDAPVVFVNQVGGNDEVLFDGGSFVVEGDELIAKLDSFSSQFQSVDVLDQAESLSYVPRNKTEEMRVALGMGLRDYFRKTGFDEAVIGMSGGIDSSVAAALAVDALGSESVYGISLPSKVTSDENVEDAERVADNLGIEFETIDIENVVDIVDGELYETVGEDYSGVAVENVQARVRGVILMAIANARNSLVLTPDNKSEAGVGYCTLYGDAIGAIAPLGDVCKRYVYGLSKEFNNSPPEGNDKNVIPHSVIDKQPTAELREDQTDEDELPPYNVVDRILEQYVEDGDKIASIVSDSDEGDVQDVIERLHRSEFKKYQTPPPLRVTKKAFGKGWKYPIAADYSILDDR